MIPINYTHRKDESSIHHFPITVITENSSYLTFRDISSTYEMLPEASLYLIVDYNSEIIGFKTTGYS